MAALILFGSFFILMLLTVPIGYSIGLATLITLVTTSKIPLVMISQNAVAGVDSFPLLAIPFFMLAGNIMSGGGIAKRLVDFAETIVGSVTGGLAMVTTATSMFFAAISGSAVATTSAVGAFMIPAMKNKGYDEAFSASLTAAAGTVGVIIPPSVPFVIYGVVSSTSITDLFKAGFLPGILMGIALMLASYIIAKKHGYVGTQRRVMVKEVWESFKDAIWALLSPIIILGGIYSGYFTPTEAAVVSVVYSTIVGRYVYKELDNEALYKALKDTVVINGATTFMIGLSLAFAAYLSLQQIPATVAAVLTSITSNKTLLLLIINAFLLLIGTLIDNIPATIVLTPILLPVVIKLGMSPVTFGVMLTMNLAIGFVTPPYGINLFVASAISDISIGDMMRFMWYFLLALLVVLMLTTYCTPVTMLFL
ncbi:MAG TPA: TRAP transporter large permease [Firmicutes bacterium]|nr:TRAP transporter large permease [Bacillota bacterium]